MWVPLVVHEDELDVAVRRLASPEDSEHYPGQDLQVGLSKAAEQDFHCYSCCVAAEQVFGSSAASMYYCRSHQSGCRPKVLADEMGGVLVEYMHTWMVDFDA
jgi:hypothetical protein